MHQIYRGIFAGLSLLRERISQLRDYTISYYTPTPSVLDNTPLTVEEDAYTAVEDAFNQEALDKELFLALGIRVGPNICYITQTNADERIIAPLIDRGANVNARLDSGGETPLMNAALRENNAIIPLITRGADVNATDRRGWSALSYYAHSIYSVKTLIDHGADLKCPLIDPAQSTPNKTLLFILLRKIRHDTFYVDEKTIVDLIAQGADPNATFTNGETALMFAASSTDSSDVVKALAAAGAEIDVTYPEGKTALMHAINRGDANMAKTLITAGADITRGYDGEGVLEFAIRRHREAKEDFERAISESSHHLPTYKERLDSHTAIRKILLDKTGQILEKVHALFDEKKELPLSLFPDIALFNLSKTSLSPQNTKLFYGLVYKELFPDRENPFLSRATSAALSTMTPSVSSSFGASAGGGYGAAADMPHGSTSGTRAVGLIADTERVRH